MSYGIREVATESRCLQCGVVLTPEQITAADRFQLYLCGWADGASNREMNWRTVRDAALNGVMRPERDEYKRGYDDGQAAYAAAMTAAKTSTGWKGHADEHRL